MERVYDFAIVRVSPDPRRGELVNIGIVVFGPQDTDVRILASLAKVQALHGELDLAQLHALPDRVKDYVPGALSVEDRYRGLRKVGMVELSDLGQFSVRNDADYELTVGQLMSQLVAPTLSKSEKDGRQSKLHTQVRNIIREAKILGRTQDDINRHKIVAHYPVDADRGLYADFAGRNSKFYVTEVIDYRVGRGINSAKFNESAKAAFVLREVGSIFNDSNRFLLYAASNEVEHQVRPHLKLLEEFATDFVNFESAADRARYVQQLALAFGGELPIAAE